MKWKTYSCPNFPGRLAFVSLLCCFLNIVPVRADETADLPARSAEDFAANEMAREVFAAEQYWWKRTSDVKSGSTIGDFFSYVYDAFVLPILQGLWDVLKWLINKLSDHVGLPNGDWSKGVPFLWTIIGFLALYVAWRLIALYRVRRLPEIKSSNEASINVLPQSDQLLAQARLALEQGDHRAAIRLVLLSLLAWLQDQGKLRYDPSRSNREYQRDLDRWPASATVFRDTADPFERCWYGGRNLSAEQVRDVIALCVKQFQGANENP